MNAIQIAEICATDMHAPHITASKHAKIKKCAHFTDKINKIDYKTNEKKKKKERKFRLKDHKDKHQIKLKVTSRECQMKFQFIVAIVYASGS